MKVLLFGIAKDIVGASSLTITDDMPRTANELKQYLTNLHPKFGTLSSFAVAVNNQYADDAVQIKSTDEIAIIPPVSGG